MKKGNQIWTLKQYFTDRETNVVEWHEKFWGEPTATKFVEIRNEMHQAGLDPVRLTISDAEGKMIFSWDAPPPPATQPHLFIVQEDLFK
jgi:hypothetical protein